MPPAVTDRFFRKLRAFERPLYHAHLLSLTDEDRHRRFQGAVTDAAISAHARRLDFRKVVLSGCFIEGVLRGVGEVALEGPGDVNQDGERPAGEIAISVDPAYQGRGIGTELTRRALRIAQNRGAGAVWLYCLPENAPMRAIVRKLGSTVRIHDGRIDAELQLQPPTLLSRLGESMEEGVGVWRSVSQLVLSRSA